MNPGRRLFPDDLVMRVRDLIQLDLDAVWAFAEAIDKVDAVHGEIRERLTAFQEDHERHIRELSALLEDAGYDPPEAARDLEAVAVERLVAVRSALGTEQALRAMRQNELLMNRRLEDAVQRISAPPDLVEIIVRYREDERAHLQYIERALRERRWEGEAQRI